MIRASDDHRALLMGDRVLARVVKREGWRTESWVSAEPLPEPLGAVVKNAIFSLDGLPSASALAARIHLILREQSVPLFRTTCQRCGQPLRLISCTVFTSVPLYPYGFDLHEGLVKGTDQERVQCSGCEWEGALEPVE